MTHNERQNIRTETEDIMQNVKTAYRLLVGLWEDNFFDGLPINLNAEKAEYVNDMFRVVTETMQHSIMDYDELTACISVDGMRARCLLAEYNRAAAEAEKLFDEAKMIVMERVNTEHYEERLRTIGNMPDAEAIPALRNLIDEMRAAA